MALIWQKQIGGTRYEVRSTGRTRRLYTNGVLHSQYNPGRPVTGSVWDLFLISAFFHDPAHVRRVLVLGVGGGAIIRQLQYFIQPALIIGIEYKKNKRPFFQRPQVVYRQWAALHSDSHPQGHRKSY